MLRSVSVLPTLVTMGNLLAGVLALSYLLDAAAETDTARRDALWSRAAWMVFLGMFCDALDGRIARMTRTTSAFGAQLDSLADIVTFGVVPAMLGKALLTATFPMVSPRLLVALCVVYVVGAALRLARYNVESARVSHEGEGHVTMVFRGIPSPAAAGVLASLVLLWTEYDVRSLDWVVLFVTPLLGVLMISRLPYPHLVNRFLEGRRPLPTVVVVIVVIFFGAVFFQETIAAAFFAYAVSGVVLYALARWTGRPRWVFREEEDEAPEDDENDEAGEPRSGDANDVTDVIDTLATKDTTSRFDPSN